MGRADGELVLSGHGHVDGGDGPFAVVPPGTSVVMYAQHGETIYDWEGNAIETGVPHKRFGMPAAVEIFGPGEKLPDYWLSEPTGLHIEATPRNVTVTRPTRLSELLQPNQGTVHWAARRWVQP